MDPPPLTTTATTTTAAATTTTTVTPTPTPYPESLDSSPRSRTTDSYFDDPPPPPKLRLMCSYGGHILPRPHDKSLCYVGGDTRMVVVDRNTTLASLSTRLSNTLLNGKSFTLKYQLPNEDLDSLISVTTDEDLDNMIDEYDRTTGGGSSNGGKSSRLRLFCFPVKLESTQSIGPILESSNCKNDDWFLNALNGANGLMLNRGFSDSASVNCLLGLDDDHNLVNNVNNSSKQGVNGNYVAAAGSGGGKDRDVDGFLKKGNTQDVHSVPDSPMLETTSSFGSTSSSPSLANLPPIRVHVVDDQSNKGVGIEDQFAQISVGGGGGGGQKSEDGFLVISSPPPPLPVSLGVSSGGVPVVMSGGDYQNRVFSDDERSDHGVPVGYRKAPLPQQTQPPQQQQPQPVVVPPTQQKFGSGGGGAVDLPSPDSVSSDSSLSNAINRQKQTMMYQDQIMQIPSGVSRVVANAVDPKMNTSDPNARVQIQQQVQDSGHVMQQQLPQYEQHQQHQQQQPQQPQQFIHGGTHYIQHHPAGAVPISAYYPVYPQQPQLHHQHHPQMDQPYPLYYVPARQHQPYNLPGQQNSVSEPTAAAPSSRSQTPPSPAMVPSATYNPMRNAPMAKPEMAAAGMYRTATTGAPQLVQVPSSQHQQQFVGYSQVHHPSQSVAPTSAGPANFAYEFADPSHAQIYYTQPLAPSMPSHYQTMTTATGVAMPENSAQLPNENMKQQNRTSQPI